MSDYLTRREVYAEYFSQHPLRFSDTLPCFNIANKDGRLDSFPMETCRIVLEPGECGLSDDEDSYGDCFSDDDDYDYSDDSDHKQRASYE